MTWPKALPRVLFVALGLGLAADALFYGKLPGVSALVFVLIAVGALFWLGHVEGLAPRRANLWLLAPLLFFAAMVGLRANLALTLFNQLATLGLFVLFARFYARDRLASLALPDYVVLAVQSTFNAVALAVPLLPVGAAMVRGEQRSRAAWLPIARGLLLAAPVLIVFAGLLSSADLVFAGFLANLVHLGVLRNLPDLLMQLLVILALAWVLGGLLVDALSQRKGTARLDALPNSAPLGLSIGFGETATVLVLVNLLFLAFGVIQFAYLFGGVANISGDGFTYADYARRGFFELVAVAVLSLCLILGLNGLTWRENRRQQLVFNGLSTGMVALLLVLLASALRRMFLYEEVYGYTELRLYVHIFMLWLGVALAWFVFTVWLRPRRFAIGGFLVALGFLATMNLINPDATIAEQNLARYSVTGQVDVTYLSRLSDDAVPILVTYIDRLNDTDHQVLQANLAHRLARMQQDTAWRQWASYHLAHDAAYEALVGNKQALGLLTAASP